MFVAVADGSTDFSERSSFAAQLEREGCVYNEGW